MKRSLVGSLRRRLHGFQHDIHSGVLFQKHPSLLVGDVMWLAVDSQYLGILRTHEAFQLLSVSELRKNCGRGGREEDLWDLQSSDEDIVQCYRALSSVSPSLRTLPSILVATSELNHVVLPRIPHLSPKLATSLVKQIPTLSVAHSRTSDMAVQLCNHWIGRLHQLPSVNDARAFLQTVGSQFTRPECAGIVCSLDMRRLEECIDGLLARRQELRRFAPTVLTTLSKLHEVGLPLSPLFDKTLELFMSFVVRRPHCLTSGEALRVLSTVCRIRSLQKSRAYEQEADELLSIVCGDMSQVDGVELAMLMSSVAYHFSDAVMGNRPSIPIDKLLDSMTLLVGTMSLRGFISCCRSVTLLSHGYAFDMSDALCSAVVRRCATMLFDPNQELKSRTVIGSIVADSKLFEKLTVLAVTNVFASRSPNTRAVVHGMIVALVKQHPYELTATNLSLIFSTLAATFGVPIGSGEIQNSVETGPLSSREVRRRSFVREVDPALLSMLISKATMATRMSQYVYSVMLRSFCRLGLEYDEVSVVVGRIVNLRFEANSHMGPKDSSSPYSGEVDVSEQSPESGDFSWDTRTKGPHLMSSHMSEIVMSTVVAIGCTDPVVLAYVAWAVLLHSDGRVEDRLREQFRYIARYAPSVQTVVSLQLAEGSAMTAS